MKFTHWITLIGCLLLCPAAQAELQDPVKVNVRITKPLVKLGAQTDVRITVQGTREAEILEIPEVDGLLMGRLLGPQTTEIMEAFGGRVQRRTTLEWSFAVRPSRAGEFTIPPIQLRIQGNVGTYPDQPITVRVIEDLEGADHCFLKVIDAPERVFEGQPFDLDLRFGTDLTSGEVDLYLPWWPNPRGVLDVENSTRALPFRFRVNERTEAGVAELPGEERSGISFRVFQLSRRYIATRPGTLDYEAGTFQFSEVLRRATVFSSGRFKRYYAQSEPFEIEVLPVPEEGRPLEWTGAVGEMSAQRRVTRRDVDVGGTITLEVFWSGLGNLEFFDIPDLKRLDEFKDFRVLGIEDKQYFDERRVSIDLVPTSAEIEEIPAVPLWVFNPEKEAYELIKTDPVPIRVRFVEDEVSSSEEWVGGIDIHDLKSAPQDAESTPTLGAARLLSSGLGLLLGWWMTRTLVRKRQGDPNSASARRRRRALKGLEGKLNRATSSSSQAAALARFLAARSMEPDSAWIGRDLTQWCDLNEASGRLRDAMGGVAHLLSELDEAAWAQEDHPMDRARIRAVARDLIREGF